MRTKFIALKVCLHPEVALWSHKRMLVWPLREFHQAMRSHNPSEYFQQLLSQTAQAPVQQLQSADVTRIYSSPGCRSRQTWCNHSALKSNIQNNWFHANKVILTPVFLNWGEWKRVREFARGARVWQRHIVKSRKTANKFLFYFLCFIWRWTWGSSIDD